MDIKKTVFIVEDDQNLVELLKASFEDAGYKVKYAVDGEESYTQILAEVPDILILDLMLPKLSGYELCQQLRAQETTSLLPVIMLTARDNTVDKITGLRIGADDYLTKPFDMSELIVRMETLLSRKERLMSTNPLTGLPGNLSIVENANRRLRNKEKFAFAYLDINDFKAYNDIYGFQKGDTVIRFTGQLIRQTLNQYGTPEDFVGHIGGDDFIFITSADKVDFIAEKLTSTFDREVLRYYTESDRTKGYLITRDRRGIVHAFSLMSISIGATTNENKEFKHYAEIVDIVTELKRFAKLKRKGSIYVKDRRTDGEESK